MAVQKKLTIAQLTEVDESYRKELEAKVYKMHQMGYSFLLCWNFHRDSLKAWEKAKAHKVTEITEYVRGLYIKEDYGKEVILVAMQKNTVTVRGVSFPAQEALQQLGLIPVKTKISGDLRNPSYNYYRLAEPHEVVAFL